MTDSGNDFVEEILRKEKLLDDSSVLKSNSQETLNQNKDNNFVDEPSLDVTRKVSFQLSFEEKNLDARPPLGCFFYDEQQQFDWRTIGSAYQYIKNNNQDRYQK